MSRQRTSLDSAFETGQQRRFCSENIHDRRIIKTRDGLRNALASLIAEKPYNGIVIKEILERANVGRSTFYTHFRDKDDLLVSSIYGMLESAQVPQPASVGSMQAILWFALPIFEYHYSHRDEGRFLEGRVDQHARLQSVLTDMIGDALKGRAHDTGAPTELIARYIASTFVLVLDWWLASSHPISPKEIESVFRSFVLPVLRGVLGEHALSSDKRGK